MDERSLQRYAELVVKVALNLQPGQRLLIIGALANGGTSLEAAPLAREVASAAYRAGAPLVETLYGDEMQQLLRFRDAPKDSFGTFSSWFPGALRDHVAAGHAVLSISANDPDLLQSVPADQVSSLLQATAREMRAFREQISRNDTNWAVVAAPNRAWARKMFPELADAEALQALWGAISRMCRLDAADPLAAWEAHLADLGARSAFLNARRYAALHYRGPGTDLTIGLPAGHIWVSGRSATSRGALFTANLPTEEVFTIADRAHVEGQVRASKPLSYGGTLIDGFSMTFERGRVVRMTAERSADTLQRLLDTDDGAGRLGEIALVPHSSPISQSGLLFYNTLFDENAASHVALGNAYRFTLRGGSEMTDDEFEQAGGNRSGVHVDFMIGSGDLDIDGVLAGGVREPLMRRGEWAAPAHT